MQGQKLNTDNLPASID